ncbi:MAG: hypothetical protein ACHRHE_16905 [Tepidisphaerales bacterium]
MPDTTRAQNVFLRAFRLQPAGPNPDQWPSPAILRRWLRRPTFRRALASIQDTLRIQSDFHLATAATRASAQLASLRDPSPDQTQSESLDTVESILRLAHVRQRFAAIESRHDTTRTLAGELATAQSELTDLRAQLAAAEHKLRLSVPLDPYIGQRAELAAECERLNAPGR